ncbi:MAG: hypothetical protein ACPGJS_00445 [Flammeovirgaceae bacterium]
MLTLFSDYAVDGTDPVNPFGQHAIMIERYRGVIKARLFEFTGEDSSKYNSEIEALSWGGLIDTILELHGTMGFNFIGEDLILKPGEIESLDQLVTYRGFLYKDAYNSPALFQDGPCQK